MSTKAIKREFLAAIAMTLVAVLALSGSTYAWFATNASVTANTSSISAKTNVAFLSIATGHTGSSGTDATFVTDSSANKALNPSRWAKNFNASGTTSGALVYNFETAEGKLTSSSEMKDGTLAFVGTPGAAVAGDYAKVNEFNVCSKGEDMTNLVVSSVTVTSQGSTTLDPALSVLIYSNGNWVLYQDASTGTMSITTSNGGILASTVSSSEIPVDVYIFYDGDNSNVKTANTSLLTKASSCLAIEFSATPPTN